ncbi:TonB family C-terminal domain-containing protein [Maribacter orientalis]|uniref:TonB family C-terminal domain-containing protein n=1 Tax=Maribacter orientalis TaxID=228957 RepID=A0A1H7R7J6_9FLAO|nr:M56 family metallopeptidase [Maribacter orientalis]SEL55925.1 TonB family C-terminal domain-containing protein [Maribacter orientalis]
MIQYILECIAFQLLFLGIYDFFLKRETFFQWSRVYLLGTFVLSLILPWVKIEAFKQKVPQTFAAYPEYLWGLQNAEVVVNSKDVTLWNVTWQEGVLYGGMIVALLFFSLKIRQLYLLKKRGEQVQFPNFTQVIITNSSNAFSFFKSIFIGDKVLKMKHDTIIAHELVHIKQGHTWDLLFFELMRIIAWFNPLVYVYQNRISELHEFIADAHVAKEDKSEQYQQLLSQVFQTEHISFINQFFTKSLIKKRIVMLQKSKSKKVWQLKYLLLIPMVLGMLLYSSCEVVSKNEYSESINETSLKSGTEIYFSNVEHVPVFPGCENVTDKKACFNEMMQQHISKNFSYPEQAFEAGIEGRVNVMFTIDEYGNVDNLKMRGPDPLLEGEVERIIKRLPKMQPAKHQGKEVGIPYSIPIVFKLDYLNSSKVSNNDSENKSEVPFAVVDEVPIFPGCEDAADKRACFNDKIQLHIGKNFNYPKAAQDANIEGRVSTMFMITTEGVIENIKMRGPDKLLEDEVERIIKRLPNMIPGKNEGKPVNVPYSIPVTFKLQ